MKRPEVRLTVAQKQTIQFVKQLRNRGRVNNHCLARSEAVSLTKGTQIVKIVLAIALTVRPTAIVLHETTPNYTRRTIRNASLVDASYNKM